MELHVTCRPPTLDDFIGNTITKKTLQSMFDNKDIPHAILFTGMTGCGKTTLARIVASQLNCPPEPTNPDYIEYDIAQMGGIDNAREIRKQIPFQPFLSDCRIWVLDEVHRGSSAFKEGMLKATEEIPNHIYFILCTTRPEEIINTLKRRCTIINVEPLQDRQMMRLLKKISFQFPNKIPEEILKMIIRVADGSPGKAIKSLDTIKHLRPEDMEKAIQQYEQQEELEKNIPRALFKKSNWQKISKMLKACDKDNAEGIRIGVLNYMKTIALSKQPRSAEFKQAVEISKWFEDNFQGTDGHAKLVFACIEALKE